MSDVYRIKPPAWNRTGQLYGRQAYQAETVVGIFTLAEHEPGKFTIFLPRSGLADAESLNDAKSKAEACYRMLLMPALDPA